MPLNAISLARLAECHPLLAERAKQVSVQFEAAIEGYAIQVSQGLRSWNYQTALYAQGRQPVANVNALRGPLGLAPLTDAQNVVVTKAGPGQSNHNYGYACDWIIVSASGELDWDGTDPKWQKLIALAPPNGLRSGVCWGDRPHMELAEVPEVPTVEAMYALKNVGLAEAWARSGLPSVASA